ncbi:MAG: hypothetical protein ABII26_05270, partial [Pseudomonadota bacterium]
FTARFARAAEIAEYLFIVFSPDPRGIGFAFHGAGKGENTMNRSLREKSKYLYQKFPLRNSDKISFSACFAALR